MRGAALALALILAGCGSPQLDTSADVTAIEAQMHARFDRPQAKLDAGPIVVSGDHAVADWTQGPMGGRALFERRDGKWTIVLCSGDALRTAAFLTQARVPTADAERIMAKLADSERAVAPDRIAKMRSFTGIVTVDQMPK
ncbi:MAG: copper uptake system-associated protein [Hyphomicrobiaceae bacterium]|nr:copper uptake system-associated protein [Hyphomicrobiaceae bacterium]